MKSFFKEKGLYLFCLALVLAATVSGVLALRTVVRGVQELTQSRQDPAREDAVWSEPGAIVQEPVTGLPESAPAAAQDRAGEGAASAGSPAASSGSGEDPASSDAAQSTAGSAGPSAAPALPRTLPTDKAPLAEFSGDELVYNETLGDWRTHNGADYAVTAGGDVPAAAAGRVTSVYEDPLWGWVVQVADRGGTVWRYCGLAEAAVAQDDTVARGDTLGVVGTIAGESRLGPHFHLETQKDEAWLDPEQVLGKQ